MTLPVNTPAVPARPIRVQKSGAVGDPTGTLREIASIAENQQTAPTSP